MRNLLLAGAGLVSACVCAPSAPPLNDVTPLVLAEHAFAAETAARGWNAGVRAFAAADAVIAGPPPVGALASLDPAADATAGSTLQWRPAFAAMARSQDLGFTTGPYFLRGKGYVGHYFTVWRREPDGRWKWIFDGGVNVLDDAPQLEGAPVAHLPGTPMRSTAANALDDVRKLEAALAAGAMTDAAGALLQHCAGDVRVHRAARPRAVNRRMAQQLLTHQVPAIRYHPASLIASHAGDLVLAFGTAEWSDGDRRQGSYARVWQSRRDGWRVVFDQLVPPR